MSDQIEGDGSQTPEFEPEQKVAFFQKQTVSAPIFLHGELSNCLVVTSCGRMTKGVE